MSTGCITSGAESLEPASPCVYVANHQNVLDVPIAARLYTLNTETRLRVVAAGRRDQEGLAQPQSIAR
ncbi:MAG: hypothetical protein GEU90_16710 [Gemmatimonas sp.]|nr:hypothetical protein [Gemmatimonas sp.]